MLFSKPAVARQFARAADEFGDSYTEDVDAAELLQLCDVVQTKRKRPDDADDHAGQRALLNITKRYKLFHESKHDLVGDCC